MNRKSILAMSGLVRGPAYPGDLVKRVLHDAKVDLGLVAIYTTLNRLESSGMVKSYFDESGERTPSGRRRKLYQLTADGHEILREIRLAEGPAQLVASEQMGGALG
ncbi:MAG: PadR family transcriptional regulator [Planctomycetota bacterium]